MMTGRNLSPILPPMIKVAVFYVGGENTSSATHYNEWRCGGNIARESVKVEKAGES